MGGKRTDAGAISKWIGSLGEIAEPPTYYYEFEAAQILGCSVIELKNHPQKHSLMREAFTYRNGKNQGEYMRECNPLFQQQVKAAREELAAARK